MADEEIVFENEGEEEVEFVDEASAPPDPDAALPEEIRKKSKSDLYARLRELEESAAKPPADPTDRIAKAVTDAFGKVAAPAAPAGERAPGESDLAFHERLKKDLFDEEKAEGVLNEAIDRRLGPRLAQTLDLTYRQAEKIMELDPETGPVFRRFKGEILEYVKRNFPPEVQRNPQALEIAYKQVSFAHLDEIAQERAEAILAAERKKGETAVSAKRTPVPIESGSTAGASAAPRKRIVQITQEDRRIADNLGVEASVIAARRVARMS